MWKKTIVIILTVAIILGLINIILIYIYDSQIDKFMNKGYYQELRTFTRLKYLLGDSINSLQLIVFFFDIFYLLVYYLLNNQRFLSYFNLDLDSIPQQNSSEYSNYLLELFFTCLIKLLSLIMSVIFSSQTITELNKILGNADFSNIDKDGQNILSFGKNAIIVLITFNSFNMLVFIMTYAIKLHDIGQSALRKEKHRTEVLYDLLQNNSRASMEPINQ